MAQGVEGNLRWGIRILGNCWHKVGVLGYN